MHIYVFERKATSSRLLFCCCIGFRLCSAVLGGFALLYGTTLVAAGTVMWSTPLRKWIAGNAPDYTVAVLAAVFGTLVCVSRLQWGCDSRSLHGITRERVCSLVRMLRYACPFNLHRCVLGCAVLVQKPSSGRRWVPSCDMCAAGGPGEHDCCMQLRPNRLCKLPRVQHCIS